jgi:hypothetical protein
MAQAVRYTIPNAIETMVASGMDVDAIVSRLVGLLSRLGWAHKPSIKEYEVLHGVPVRLRHTHWSASMYGRFQDARISAMGLPTWSGLSVKVRVLASGELRDIEATELMLDHDRIIQDVAAAKGRTHGS